MASTLSTLLDTLAADFARPDGTSPYVYDLSAADRVKVGRYTSPWVTGAPCACLWADSLAGSFDAALGRYGRTLTLGWAAWVPLVDRDLATAEGTAADVAADILRALEVDRKKGIGATEMLVSANVVVGVADGAPHKHAHVLGTMTLTYRVDTGA